MRRVLALALALALSSFPTRAVASSAWGSAGYGDPPGWCTNFSDMWVATVITNDPHVGTNPERNTFYGFHPNPGYDDWFGYFYGDFRGTPGDASGWVKLLHENYPDHYHWNFADNGWAVHGHAKEYIAYYNWTFGGQCGIGAYGSESPPPFMADEYGYPVVDIYVDSRPPFDPQPRVSDISTTSVSFTWDPVSDQGDGAGQDYFAAGMGHYSSWLTLGSSPIRLQAASTIVPRTLTQSGMRAGQTACVHVVALDKLLNATPEQVACAGPLQPPPMPDWGPLAGTVVANPTAPGLVGLDSLFWLAPTPVATTVHETYEGLDYTLTAVPIGAAWNFGDRSGAIFFDASGFGTPYPEESAVAHVYQADDEAGYRVESTVSYSVSWTVTINGRRVGPYPLGTAIVNARPLLYPVEQAQPEVVVGGQVADQPLTPAIATATTGPAGVVARYWG
ncbi:MAG TPA: hypothetical protein VNU19_11080 [Candidatus Acidoferrum sp.]|jgi:hypothetical protein|nr:hypothetical protein [Candidatus Acidoferrum sp.]